MARSWQSRRDVENLATRSRQSQQDLANLDEISVKILRGLDCILAETEECCQRC